MVIFLMMMMIHGFLTLLNIISLSTGVTSNRSEREVRGAGLVLQTVWGYKELRRTLEKDGWKKTDFMVNLNPPSNPRTNGGYEDSTLPLIDKGEVMKGKFTCVLTRLGEYILWDIPDSFRSFSTMFVCFFKVQKSFEAL